MEKSHAAKERQRQLENIVKTTKSEIKFMGVLQQFPIKWQREKSFRCYNRWFEKPSKKYPRGRKRKKKGKIYIIDFFLSMPVKIAFEIDGGYHSEGKTMYYDARRDADMENRGILPIRIENRFCDDYNVIFQLIKSACLSRIKRRFGVSNSQYFIPQMTALNGEIENVQPNKEDWLSFIGGNRPQQIIDYGRCTMRGNTLVALHDRSPGV